jgi:hypothetical protein
MAGNSLDGSSVSRRPGAASSPARHPTQRLSGLRGSGVTLRTPLISWSEPSPRRGIGPSDRLNLPQS